MPRPAAAREWWAEVDDVRERIERRRAREGVPARRGVRVVRPEAHAASARLLTVDARATASAARGARRVSGPATGRRRPRPRPAQLVGPRPDRIASWAVALGFLLVLAAILSAH
ncbi:MAG TPA: hypothetical protein VK756_08030 [Solirubrobacteraceae bacterium]|nr:hypothetical protein [Solirubrobacteraceae bacterium]